MANITKKEMTKVRKQVGRRFAVVNAKTLYVMVDRDTIKEAEQFVVAYKKGYGSEHSWLIVDTRGEASNG